MDEAQARATLALMEVVGKMLIGLADTGALPREFCRRAAITAAQRLEPTNDGEYLGMMSKQWLETARFFEKTPRTN